MRIPVLSRPRRQHRGCRAHRRSRDDAPRIAQLFSRCFFRERIRTCRDRHCSGGGEARASSSFHRHPCRERDGTFVLQKY